MSIAGGAWKALERGKENNCRVIQVFTKSSNQWRAAHLSEEDVAAFHRARKTTGINPAMAHNSYLINLGSPSRPLWKKSLSSLRVELERAERLGITHLVAHPGAHTGSGEKRGTRKIVEGLRTVLKETRGWKVGVLLETTAGQGTTIGHRFDQMGEMLDRIDVPERTGVCLDTCHVFVAGYELRTEAGLGETVDAFHGAVGLDRLGLVHLNDSVGGLGSGRDRHEHLGLGEIGLGGLRLVVNSRFGCVPMIMETPMDERRGNPGNMDVARGLVGSV